MEQEWLTEPMTEMYIEWCRLKGYKPAKSPLEFKIDQELGVEKAHIREFLDWFMDDIMPRFYGTILAKEIL